MSGSSPDTRAVCGALITLMWGLGRSVLCSEEGCDAGTGSERHYRGSSAGTLGVPLGGTRRVGGLLGVAGRMSGLTRWVTPRLKWKQRTPLSSRVATCNSWSPLSRLKGVQPPLPFGPIPPFPSPMALAGSRPQSCVVRHERLALRSCLAREAGSAVWLWATGMGSGGGGWGAPLGALLG